MGPQIPQIRPGKFHCHRKSGSGKLKIDPSNSLGRKKSPCFSNGIQTLPNANKEMGCHMSLKVHFLQFSFRFIFRNSW